MDTTRYKMVMYFAWNRNAIAVLEEAVNADLSTEFPVLDFDFSICGYSMNGVLFQINEIIFESFFNLKIGRATVEIETNQIVNKNFLREIEEYFKKNNSSIYIFKRVNDQKYINIEFTDIYLESSE